MVKDIFCSYCGTPFAADAGWPRRCAHCGQWTYRNPLPVAVLLLPVLGPAGRGLLTVRRGIAPHAGELALPGGFIEWGETWQAAAAREAREETGVAVDPAAVRDFMARSSPAGRLLVFGVAPPVSAAALAGFVANEEVRELVVIEAPRELAFPLHTEAVAAYFLEKGG